MKMTTNVSVKNIMLKCLAQIFLVLSIITFSGYVSEAISNKSISTNTELNEVRKINSKKTVHYKIVCNDLNDSIVKLNDCLVNFTLLLFHQANCIDLNYKHNFIAHPDKERAKGYLLFYATRSSEEFDTKQARG
jgi:hypothetical protein